MLTSFPHTATFLSKELTITSMSWDSMGTTVDDDPYSGCMEEGGGVQRGKKNAWLQVDGWVRKGL